MPYVSDKQRKYFNANRGKLEAEGVDVDEWNSASKGMHLPERSAAHGKFPALRQRAMKRRGKPRGV